MFFVSRTLTETAGFVPLPTHVQRSDNRFELKYLVSHRQMNGVLRAIAPYVRADANWENAQGYPIHSIYWDNDEWTLFWEKIEGLKDRRKLRIRLYGRVDYGFVEIKHRVDRTLQKRRARLPLDVIYRTFRGEDGELESGIALDDAVVGEAMYLRYRYRLRPRMAISYRWRAFFGRFDPDLRITCDTRIQYHTSDTDITRPFETGTYVVDPRISVLEMKFNDRVPDWLIRLVETHGLEMTRLSKYCSAVDMAHFGGQLT